MPSVVRGVERRFMYYYHSPSGRKWWMSATKDEWLQALLDGRSRPKPPPSWIKTQATEGRNPMQAAIIWNRHYDLTRKYAIWASSSEEDFREAGYL